MSIQLGSAYGKVHIDASGVRTGIAGAKAALQDLAQAGVRVGEVMQQAGRAMTLGVTLPILAVGAAAVKAASDMEETRNKVKVVFGDMSDSMLDWSKDAAKAFGMSKQGALEAAGTFGNLFTSMGLSRNESADMSKGLVQLAGDLASFNDINPEIVLEKLRSGMVGEVEPLRVLGVNLTMAAVQAKAMEMGLADANGELSQAALAQARYALIMEQTVNAQGDFARTSDSLANSMRTMRGQLNDALVMLGENFLPIALKVVHAINAMLEAFNKMGPVGQTVVISLAGMAAMAGPMLSMVGSVISIVSGLAAMGVTFSGIAAAIGTIIPVLAGVIAALGAVVAPLLLIIATIVLVYLAFKNNFGGITTTAKQLWFILKWVFQEGWNWLVRSTANGIGAIVEYFRNIDWGEIGKSIIMGIAGGLLGWIGVLIDAAKKVADAAMTAIKDALDMHSPSGVAMKLGEYTGQGYLLGLQKAMDTNEIARTVANPSMVQNYRGGDQILQLASGVTIRNAREMISHSEERLFKRMGRIFAY